MSDELDKREQAAKDLQSELNTTGLSRRGLLDRLKALGIGFGAASAVGVLGTKGAEAAPSMSISSTNAALNGIIQDSPGAEMQAGEGAETGEPQIEQAQFYYRRFVYRRFFYRRYSRFFYRRFRYYRRW